MRRDAVGQRIQQPPDLEPEPGRAPVLVDGTLELLDGRAVGERLAGVREGERHEPPARQPALDPRPGQPGDDAPAVVDHAGGGEVVPVRARQELEPGRVVEQRRTLGTPDELAPPLVGTRVEKVRAHTGGIR